MSYQKHYHEQTLNCYRGVSYDHGTIYSSGCGPASLCNALDFLGLGAHTVKEMAAFAVNCGARVEGGTSMPVLLKAAAKKYHFRYEATSKNAELREHLRKGGTAIMNNGSSYPLFSSGGHFVCAFGLASDGKVLVADSYWYSGKYGQNSIRNTYVDVIEHGIVKTSVEQCGRATIDRSPSYYLISKEPAEAKTWKTVITADCNVRQAAGKDCKIIGTMKKGASITVVDETPNWVQRKHGGWVAKKYIKKV